MSRFDLDDLAVIGDRVVLVVVVAALVAVIMGWIA
jgi:hypothetical protein